MTNRSNAAKSEIRIPNSEIKAQLAAALNLDPADIMDYKQTAAPGDYGPDPEYTVILYSFQKFLRVKPKELIPEHPAPETAEPNAEFPIPNSLQFAYAKPHRVTRDTLRQLADLLDIPYTAKTRKTQLVTKVNTYRADHGALHSIENDPQKETPQRAWHPAENTEPDDTRTVDQ